MLRVSYQDRGSNDRIFEKVVLEGVILLGLLSEGRIEGTRRRGRQRNTWGRDILKWTNKSY